MLAAALGAAALAVAVTLASRRGEVDAWTRPSIWRGALPDMKQSKMKEPSSSELVTVASTQEPASGQHTVVGGMACPTQLEPTQPRPKYRWPPTE